MSYYPPRPATTGNNGARTWLIVAIGVVFGFVMVGALLSAGDDTSSGGGYADSGYSGGSGGGGSQIYDGGSITTGDDGELIYSDDNGNGFSTGE